MRKISLLLSITALFTLVFLADFTWSAESKPMPKRTLKNNMSEVYNILPDPATCFSEIFTKGMYYGRLRLNYFYYDNYASSLHDPTGFAVGGSLIYKTAPLHGLSATAGFYTAQNLGLLDKEDALFGKTGKDTFSRYDRLKDGDWGMNVLAQAYAQYSIFKTDLKVGRQIYESFLTTSNDTKFIPVTFEGYTIYSEYVPATTLSLAWLTAMKLRDHTTFHDVITYDDRQDEVYNYKGNNVYLRAFNDMDDGSAHKGLSYLKLKAAGEDVENDLVIAGVSNKSIKNLTFDVWYTGVPDLFYSLMAEPNYDIALPDGWILTPGFRYMQQFDNGAGEIGGAALNGKLVTGFDPVTGRPVVPSGHYRGYRDADNVDSKMYAARLVLKKGAGNVMVGYSKIADEADLITPWRGFPTGGYTRTMGESNWQADCASWMFLAFYDFDKAGMIKGFRASIDFVTSDEDDLKEHLNGDSLGTDRYVVHSDLWYRFQSLPDLEARVRFKWLDGDDRTNAATYNKFGSSVDPSYSDIRFELNYLF
ncbi:conserved exported hypothetical protein [uncultured Desulfobacterium sp.]|uniref:Outer membrane porin, OprD family n=1 Tax=uncultured Desulfobacterium sp. TaxID=201089 RepID=A0A445N3I6_9BACT|nr:conserved exported hypothetical protein [uncultured Desulfobacterium sp.]